MRTHLTVTALALATLAACKGSDAGLSAAYFGNSVEPPRAMAKLRPGMTLAEAKAAAPGLKEGTGRDEGDWLLDSGSASLKLVVEFDDDRVDRLVVKADTTKLEPVLTKAWGAPTKEKERYSDEEVLVWKNQPGAWRARLTCLTRMCFVDFTNFRPLAADFFGKTPVPPGAYSKLRVGMPAAEAATVVGDPLAVEKYVAAGPDDVSIIAQVSSKEQLLTSVRLMLPTTSKALLEQAWGPGVVAKDSIDKPLTVWFDEASGWRAIWEDEAIGDSGSLEFTNYLALPALLGAGPGDFAVFTTPVLGATKDELAKAYPGVYDAKDEFFTLPPTAWASLWTRVNVDFDAAGKASFLRFGIPYEGQAQAKEQILATLEARWGKPTAGEEFGRPLLIFRATAPKIVVEDETITGEWKISYGER